MSKKNEWDKLTGKYFHVIENGIVNMQGTIIGNPHGEYYFVIYFSWLTGCLDCAELIHISSMVNNWVFYESKADMEDVYERNFANRTIAEA